MGLRYVSEIRIQHGVRGGSTTYQSRPFNTFIEANKDFDNEVKRILLRKSKDVIAYACVKVYHDA